ncbi:hypothetical protein GYMLUDRAFT_398231, partial [Collybiopsis luxurians FD-317 M1]
MKTRLVASILGLLLTGFDVTSTRRRELEHVWRIPFPLSFARSLFILARYLAIVIHIHCFGKHYHR